jgi:uncharacterized protein YjbI with pentapeptide repeats
MPVAVYNKLNISWESKNMKTYTQDEVKNIINNRVGGEVLQLRYSDLSYSDLSYYDLNNSNLRNSDFHNSDLSYSDLRNSDLRNSDLRNSNLRDSNIWNTIGNNREIKTLICFPEYHVNYTADRLQIGCENHAIKDWWEFDDKHILGMDGKKALTFWRKNKDILRMIIEHNPATPTGFERA